MLALNYKSIGLESLYNLWKTDELKSCKEVNSANLFELIANFEDKLKSSIKDKKGGDNIDYLEYFSEYNKGSNEGNEMEKVLRKVIKKLDLEYLLSPKQLLDNAVNLKNQYTNETNKCILSPFTWIYYCVKHIITEDISGEVKDLVNQLLLLKVIFGYISIIVDQGNGIVTSLEHLKYFFLYNTNNHEALYAYNMKQKDPRVRFIHDPNGKTEPDDWDSEKLEGEKYTGYDLVYEKSIHIKEIIMTEASGNKLHIKEQINKGHIDRVRMLETLRQYGGQCVVNPNNDCNIHGIYKNDNNNLIDVIALKTLFQSYESKPASELDKYPYIQRYKTKSDKEKEDWRKFSVLKLEKSQEIPANKKNKYIMMAHIMRGAMEADGYITRTNREKYCDATKSTLEFAQSIKSDVGLCSNINESRWTGEKIEQINCGEVDGIKDIETLRGVLGKPQGGGGTLVELFPKLVITI